MTLPGWRVLGITWAVALAIAAGGALWLNQMGPPRQLAGGENTVPRSTAPRESGALVAARPDMAVGIAIAPPGNASASSASRSPNTAQRSPGAPDPAAQAGEASAPPVQAPAIATASNNAPERSAAAMAAPPATLPAAAETLPSVIAPERLRDRGVAGSSLAAAVAPSATALPDGARSPSVAAIRVLSGLDPTLTEPGRHGPLPRISPDGRTPIRAYGRPFDRTDTRPRIAIIIGDFGLNASHSDDALRRLPTAVTLAITPYGYGLLAWSERARERGVETLMGIPMEPAGFPMNDPGDRALLTTLPLPENLDRLSWTLARTQGYSGAIGAIGSMRGERFAQSGEAFSFVQDSLQGRGLLYIDPRPGARNPSRAWGRSVDLVIDEPATRGEIERRLTALEALARERGSALGLAGGPTPVVVDRIAAWAETLAAKGLVLAPASVLIRRPDGISETTSRTQ